ncbi:MAG: ABC transporter permease subunit [Actinomycetota bacterium]
MSAPILERGIALRRRTMLGWGIGSGLFTALILAVFPVIRDDPTFDELLAEYPEPVLALVGDATLSSGPGFMSAELYSLVLPVMVAVIAVTTAAAALAGEDERGWLALVLAGPLARDRLVGEIALTVAVVTAGPVMASAVVVAVGGPLVELDLSFAALAAVSVSTWLFGLVFGAVALIAGAYDGRRATAVTAGVGFLLFAYGAEIVGATASWGEFLRELSPFHHLVGSQPAVDGAPWGAIVIAVLTVLAAVEFAARLLTRRDLVG